MANIEISRDVGKVCRAIRERWVSDEDAKGIVKKMKKIIDDPNSSTRDIINASKVVFTAAACDEKAMANALRELQGPGQKTQTTVNVFGEVNNYAAALESAREQRKLRRVDASALRDDGLAQPLVEAQASSETSGIPGTG